MEGNPIANLPAGLLTTPTQWPTRKGLDVLYPPLFQEYTLLHEREETELVRRAVRTYNRCKKGDGRYHYDEEDEWRTLRARVVVLRRRRFLDIYTGFIEGNLDLTGRHVQRWSEYIHGFEEYMSHFHQVAPMIETTVNTHTFSAEMEYPETSWNIKPEGKDLFAKWLLRWDIDPENWFTDASESLRVHNLWLQNREPRFQTLILPDLPRDVHEEIFRQCDKQQLLALSQTCKALQGARIHRLKTCSIEFKDIENIYDLDNDSDPPHLLQILLYLGEGRGRFLTRLLHHLSRPDHSRLMKSLSLSFTWRIPGYSSEETKQIAELVETAIFRPLFRQCSELLTPSALPNLTSLSITCARLGTSFLAALSSLENLRTLSLNECIIPSVALDALLQDTVPLPSCKIANLHLRFPRPADANSAAPETLWHILRICPGVRNLTLSLFGILDEIVFPPQPVYSKFRCIEVLERLSVQQLHPDSIPRLAEWISSPRSSGSTTAPTDINDNGDPNPSDSSPAQRDSSSFGKGLTHFKFSNSSQIPPEHTDLLIASLQHASSSMKFLTLEGLHLKHSATPSLIRKISRACPHLVALRLMACRGVKLRAVAWPHPSWAYAPALGGLRALKHFVWNFKTVDKDPTLFPLVLFERGMEPWERPGPDEQREGEEEEQLECPWYDVPHEELWFDDAEMSVLQFAVHCPTLRTFASDLVVTPVYEIIRGPRGKESLRRMKERMRENGHGHEHDLESESRGNDSMVWLEDMVVRRVQGLQHSRKDLTADNPDFGIDLWHRWPDV